MADKPASPKPSRKYFRETHRAVTFWIKRSANDDYHQLQLVTDRHFSKEVAAQIEEIIKKEKERLGLG